MARSKRDVVAERLPLHGGLKAIDAGFDDAIDLFNAAVIRLRTQGLTSLVADLSAIKPENRRAA
jgi:hypothetical protein